MQRGCDRQQSHKGRLGLSLTDSCTCRYRQTVQISYKKFPFSLQKMNLSFLLVKHVRQAPADDGHWTASKYTGEETCDEDCLRISVESAGQTIHG